MRSKRTWKNLQTLIAFSFITWLSLIQLLSASGITPWRPFKAPWNGGPTSATVISFKLESQQSSGWVAETTPGRAQHNMPSVGPFWGGILSCHHVVRSRCMFLWRTDSLGHQKGPGIPFLQWFSELPSWCALPSMVRHQQQCMCFVFPTPSLRPFKAKNPSLMPVCGGSTCWPNHVGFLHRHCMCPNHYLPTSILHPLPSWLLTLKLSIYEFSSSTHPPHATIWHNEQCSVSTRRYVLFSLLVKIHNLCVHETWSYIW